MNKYANPFFSLRAAAIIIHGGRILLCKNDSHTCHYLPGGGIESGESSADAVTRELYEETGFHFEIDRLVYIQERFYTAENTSKHEITFMYLMKESSFPIPDGSSTDRKNEHLNWISLDILHEINIVPPFLASALTNLPAHPTHIITYK